MQIEAPQRTRLPLPGLRGLCRVVWRSADCCGTARQFDGTIDAYQQSPFHGCGNLWNHRQRRCVRIKGPVYSGPYCFLPSLSFCGFDLNSRHTSKTKLAIVAIAARANRIFSNMALLLSLEALPASDFAGTHKEYQKAKEKHVLCYVRNCKIMTLII